MANSIIESVFCVWQVSTVPGYLSLSGDGRVKGQFPQGPWTGGAWEVQGPLLLPPWSDPGPHCSHTPRAAAERFITKSVPCPGRPLDLPVSYFHARSAQLHKAGIS